MGRSHTLPLDRQDRKSKPLARSMTTLQTPRKHKILPHIPFVNQTEPTTKPHSQSYRPSTHNNDNNNHNAVSLNRQNSVQTRYMTMLLALDTIPRIHNIFISFFTWLLLAGFIIFPGTFTSLSSTLADDPDLNSSETISTILHSVKNIQLLIIGAVLSGIGAGGMLWLWWRWQSNYVWLLNRIFLPGCLNSLAGLIGTLINVYSQQDGAWSITAKVTACVTGSIMVVCGALFGVYNFWVLERVKRTHGREWGGNANGRDQRLESVGEDEGLAEKIVRKAQEPALEPGSVV